MEPDNKKPHTPPLSKGKPPLPKKKGGDTILRPLRTYRGDVAYALGKNKTSLIDISVAKHKRDREHEKLSEKTYELDKRIEEEGVKIRKAEGQLSEKTRELDKRIEEEGVKIRKAEEELKKAESTWLSWFTRKPKAKEKVLEPVAKPHVKEDSQRDIKREQLSEKTRELDKRIEEEGAKIRKVEGQLSEKTRELDERIRESEKLSEKTYELDKRIEEEGVKVRQAEEELKKSESTWLSWFKQKPKEKALEPLLTEKPEAKRDPLPALEPKLSSPPPPPFKKTPEMPGTPRFETLQERSLIPEIPRANQQPLITQREKELSALKTSKERAEQVKRELEQSRARLSARAPIRFRPEKHASQVVKYLAIIGTIVLLVGGGIGLGAITYNTFTNRNVVEPEPTIPTFFPVNIQYEVQAGGLSRQDLMQALVLARNEVALATGDIAHLYLTRTLSGKAMLFSTFDFFDVLRLRIPDPFIRTLNKQFMLGIHRRETREPFLVLKTSFFENAFPGMIAWEPFMNTDLAPLFGQELKDELPVSVSPTAPSPFIDLVISNKDARVLYDEFGDIVLLYAFVDRNTIVITTTRETFLEVFKRMSSSRTVR